MKLTKCVPGDSEYGQAGWLIQFPYDAEFIEDFKDAIDPSYRQWIPATKIWWVDEDCGTVLRELFENWLYPVTVYPPKGAKKCSICNGKGLVPSTAIGVFSGKSIPNCWQACECREQQHEYDPPLKRSDFDFVMSSDFLRNLGYEHGWASR